MTRNQWLIAIGIIASVCLVAFLCVAAVGGYLYLNQRTPNHNPPQVTTPSSKNGTRQPTPTHRASSSSSRSGDQVLNLAGAEPPTLDPHLTQDSTSAEYIVEIYSGLVTLDKELNVVPDIASDWTVSDDGTVYTFHLRDNAVFHNGKPVTATDFKWSLERACDPHTGSLVADTYLGDVVGCREKLRNKANEVAGVKVIDNATLQITIDAPKVYFLSKLTYPTAFVLDKDNVERGGRTWTDQPNGTGPFKLKEWSLGEKIVLAKNEKFYNDPPKLDEVVYWLTGGSIMTRYETDELDAVPVGLADIDSVLDPTNPMNAELTVAPNMSIQYVGLNASQPPFDDPNVRKAFAMAIDKEKLANVVLRKTTEAADGVVPPAMPNYNNTSLQAIPFDPEGAKQLIADSKYGGVDGLPELTLQVSGGGGSAPRSVEAITQMWKDNLGVDVAIEQTEWATFLQDVSKRPSPYQFYTLGWIADYPDPQNFLDILFHSESLDNHSNYSNPDVDRLLEEARTETDETKRLQDYYQVEQMLINDVAWIPLWYGKDYWLTKPYVKGMVYPPTIIPRLRYVSIEK